MSKKAMNKPKLDWASRCFPTLLSYHREDSWVNRFRRRRMRTVLDLFESLRAEIGLVKILDIGGTPDFWRQLGGLDPEGYDVTLMNLREYEVPDDMPAFKHQVGNAVAAPFEDGTFDVVFSNSVIEHVGSWENQQVMASEVRRLGRRFVVQTPSYWFPFEPHARLPLFQFLPRNVRAFLIWHFKINYFPRGDSYQDCLTVSDSTLMLSKRKFARLFPSAIIQTERLLGLPKSYMAIGGWSETALCELNKENT